MSRSARSWIARAIGPLLQWGLVIALHAARLSGRRLGIAILYHRVEPWTGSDRELVPPVSLRTFDAQVRFLRRSVRVVPAGALVDEVRSRSRGARFPVSVTFDDDYACHSSNIQPVLDRHDCQGTFFLTGSPLTDQNGFWWLDLQALSDRDQHDPARLETLAEQLGLTSANGDSRPRGIHEIADAIEWLPPESRREVAARLHRLAAGLPKPRLLSAEQLRELSERGAEIGFHTRLHDALPTVSDEHLTETMDDGVEAIATVVGYRPTTIAYPHGKYDDRTASAALRAGFERGFTVDPVPARAGSDPLLVGRLEAPRSGPVRLGRQLLRALIRG